MRTLKTVETTLDIIEALQELDGAGVSELASHLDLSKGGVYNHLATLHEREYLVKDGAEYRLSHRFFNLGHTVKHRTDLYNIAKPELEHLAEFTGGHAGLIIEEFGKAIYLHREIGNQGVSEEFSARRLEGSDHLHVSSCGKAILAHLPLEYVEWIVETHGLPAKTPDTITDVDSLLVELVEIREQGYAISDEEAVQGIRAIGVPILDTDDNVLGAIAVSRPKSQLPDELAYGLLPQLVIEAANIIEVNLVTQNPSQVIRY
ncbi:IclR family transcriptional regulator [Haloferax sp. CBA1149]|uniref:Helix-turn-helix domain-containing protein n=3 Tax=Haloferax TaxID=2251 RepID=A0A6G1Z5Q5_9EURY|nr:IclR family transcriptional regulator [Haloferax sp. CBA1149]KAB1185331.1 IclR family transcriptional regulator [Haloferax sp. CBA1149]MRW81967.1 helix-turn-helix domain-containing protein [Haloferax marinisediminis]